MQKEESVNSKAFSYDVVLKAMEDYVKEHGNCRVYICTIILMLKAGELIGRSSVQPE